MLHHDQPPEVKLTRGLQAFLAYLLLERNRTHPREVLAGLFWGDQDEEHARSCLSTALWRLRRVLEPEGVPPGTYLIAHPTGSVGFNCQSDFWLDVAVFEERASRPLAHPSQALTAAEIEALEQVLPLYTGDLLEGIYADWALRERERLRCLYLNSLACLMRYYRRHGICDKGLDCGHKILQLDPLREEIHREMMQLYLDSDQRALAVQQYEACRRILAEELGIAPLEETQLLYTRIGPHPHPPTAPSLVSEDATLLEQTQYQLHSTLRALDHASEQVRHAIHTLEQTLRPPG